MQRPATNCGPIDTTGRSTASSGFATTSPRPVAGTLGGLQGKLAQAEMVRVSGKDPTSFTAYDYLTKGWYDWYKFTRDDNAAARALFEQARQADPNYARAYAGLAWTYANEYDFDWTEDYEGTVKHALRDGQHGGTPRPQRLSSPLGTWLGASLQLGTRRGQGQLFARPRAQSERRRASGGNGKHARLYWSAATSDRAAEEGNSAQPVP